MFRPIHFEIHADDPARAQRFYTELLGWRFQQWGQEQYWSVETGAAGDPGINGGLLPRRGPRPDEAAAVNAYVCTVDVPAIDEYVGKAQQAGAQIAVPKMEVPGIGWLAYVKDTEGNIFGMLEVARPAA